MTPAQVSRGMAELKEKLVIEPVPRMSLDGRWRPDRSNFGTSPPTASPRRHGATSKTTSCSAYRFGFAQHDGKATIRGDADLAYEGIEDAIRWLTATAFPILFLQHVHTGRSPPHPRCSSNATSAKNTDMEMASPLPVAFQQGDSDCLNCTFGILKPDFDFQNCCQSSFSH